MSPLSDKEVLDIELRHHLQRAAQADMRTRAIDECQVIRDDGIENDNPDIAEAAQWCMDKIRVLEVK